MATTITATHGLSSGTAMTISSNQWLEAKVIDIVTESPEVKTYVLQQDQVLSHEAGQHYELRLTGEDGYQAARLYSAAPTDDEKGILRLSIQLVATGEVTPYVHDVLAVGDSVEIRGPFGRFFVWHPSDPEPILLIGGGSGVIPLAAVLQAHANAESEAPIRLLYSSRTYDDILYKEFLIDNPNVTITLTKDDPEDWQGSTGRISLELLREQLAQFDTPPICYVCGMSPFVSAINDGLQELGISLSSIRTERFG